MLFKIFQGKEGMGFKISFTACSPLEVTVEVGDHFEYLRFLTRIIPHQFTENEYLTKNI